MLSPSNDRIHLNLSKPFARYMLMIILGMIIVAICGILFFQYITRQKLIGSALRNYSRISANQFAENVGNLEDPSVWQFQAQKLLSATFSYLQIPGISGLKVKDLEHNELASVESSMGCQKNGLTGESSIIFNNQVIAYLEVCNETLLSKGTMNFVDFSSFSRINTQMTNDLGLLVAIRFTKVIGALENPELWEFSLDHISLQANRVLNLDGVVHLRLLNKIGNTVLEKSNEIESLKALITIKENIIFNGQLFGFVELDIDYPELRQVTNLFAFLNLAFLLAFILTIYIFPIQILKKLEAKAIRIDKELGETQIQLIQAGKLSAIGELAAGIAHEINNPLMIISGYCLQLEKIAKQEIFDSTRQLAVIEKIVSSTNRIVTIVRGLKTLSRDGRNDPFIDLDLQSLITETISLCLDRIHSEGVTMTFKPSQDSITVEGRPSELAQVLLNLINNSLDAIEAMESKWIQISVADLGASIEIRLTDCGLGIPPDIATKLFDPFFTTKAVGKGTGLGLSISAGIIKNHHGEIRIDFSSKNTCFVIRLPKKKAQSAAA